jgi:hypothetical protein
METKRRKRLPYGISNFETIRIENYIYIDKTQHIELLEDEDNKNLFFTRPRKFGKSLLFSMLSYYYDINQADKFEQLFGDLYIGQHPTPRHNTYLVLNFDFSGLNTSSKEDFKISFSRRVQETIRDFLYMYHDVFPEKDFYKRIDIEQPGVDSLRKAFSATKSAKKKLFIIIDEYDHFANDLIALGTQGDNVYNNLVKANGIVRDLYETLKEGSKTVIDRIIITGVTPIMLDDLTSGFNIADNLTIKKRYNEMLGFTQEEVKTLMEETSIDPALIIIDMEAYYNGYLFHEDAENSVYNPAMILYFFKQILEEKKPPKNIIDQNLKTDYSRLRRLMQNKNNRETLLQIMKDGYIVSKISEQFSIDALTDDNYFISLLFYMGMLTIGGTYQFEPKLRIPNYSIKTLYWEYLAKQITETSSEITVQSRLLNNAIYMMAMEGDVKQFITYISDNVFKKLSDYDLQHFDEKYIQVMMLAYLFMSEIYVPMSEYETVPGRADIFLQKNPLLPEIKYEWLFEIKYCKASATASEITAKRDKGFTQLTQYLQAYRMKDRPNLRAALLVFIGKDNVEVNEL